MPTVTVTGERSGTAPLTWGQRSILRIMHMLGPQEYTTNLGSFAALPDGTDVQSALAWIGHLVSSYEGMRTRFVASGDDWVQVLDATGTLEVPVLAAAPAELAATAEAERDRIQGSPFRVSEEWAVRFTVIADGDRALALVWAASHIVLDLWGLWALEAVAYRPGCDIVTDIQPMDRAAFEQSPAGRDIDKAAIEYCRDQLERATVAFPAGAHPPRENCRFWYADFESPVMAAALDRHAAAFGTSPAVVLRTAINAGLAEVAGIGTLTMSIVASNRFDNGSQAAIGSFTQIVPTTLQVAGASWTGLLRRAMIANVLALQHGAFDPRSMDRLEQELAQSTSGLPNFSMTLNDMRPPVTAAAQTPDLDGLDRGKVEWVTRNNEGDSTLFLWVGGERDVLAVRMMIDTTCLTLSQAEQILVRAEQKLLTEAPAGR